MHQNRNSDYKIVNGKTLNRQQYSSEGKHQRSQIHDENGVTVLFWKRLFLETAFFGSKK